MMNGVAEVSASPDEQMTTAAPTAAATQQQHQEQLKQEQQQEQQQKQKQKQESTSGSNGVDPKLVHLVRKFLSFSADDAPNADHIVHCLRTQHREYQRKDLARLKRQVQKVIKRLNKNRNGGDGSGKKRSSDQAQEDQYEKRARKHDAQREVIAEATGGCGLNASLRNSYRQVQQTREKEQIAQQAVAAALAADKANKIAAGVAQLASDKATKVAEDAELAMADKANKIAAEAAAAAAAEEQLQNYKSPSKSTRKKKSTKRTSFGAAGDVMDRSQLDLSPSTAFSKPVPRPTERYSDLGGMTDVLQQIKQLIEYPMVRPELYRHLGVDPPRGVLLRGPPGCGKSHLSNAIAGELGVPYYKVSAPELVSSMSGESEGRIRELFQAASQSAPSLIFLDELDAIAPKRSDSGGGRGMEKRMVAQLLTCMDLLDPQYTRNNAPVLVLGATNRSDSIDAALRRAGRFDKEILLGVPDEEARENILKTMTRGMKLSGDFDFKVLARKTPGYVGADVRSLTKEAAVIAINRIFSDVLKDQAPQLGASFTAPAIAAGTTSGNGESGGAPDGISGVSPLNAEQMEPLFVTMEDFLAAIPKVQPSSKREGFATVPDVAWSDIGALSTVREELTLSVLAPIRTPEKFQTLGIPLPAGCLLYGPPGCGKTLLAKAIANESGANFISVKGPELLDKYVGESERAVRLVFERARSSSPCIVFFDELDSLCPKRGSDSGGGGGVSERVVNQLLTEMDGLESRRSVFVIAATNRPELIDPAMMRPGRLDKLLYVPLPTPEDRVAILTALSKGIKLASDVDLTAIGSSPRAQGYSGADCAALLREAGLAVLKDSIASDLIATDSDVKMEDDAEPELFISKSHFDYAFDHVLPSVSIKDQARYDRMRNRMAHARSRGGVTEKSAEGEEDNGAVAL